MEDTSIGDIVEVSWCDIFMKSGWHEYNHGTKPEPCTSIGYLASNEKDYLTLSQTRPADPSDYDDDADYWGNIVTIPKGTVTNVKKLTF